MVVLRMFMEEISRDNITIRNRNIVEPSTLIHLVFLLISTGLLYISMKLNYGIIGEFGSSIFLSLTITYCSAAYIFTTTIGRKVMTIEDKGIGIFTLEYWILSLKALIPIFILCMINILIINYFFERDQIDYFMSGLFIVMSIGQGLSLVVGCFQYYENKDINSNSHTSNHYVYIRMLVILLIFLPLIWWFGYGAKNASDQSMNINFIWFIFTILICVVTFTMDKYTSNMRHELGFKGAKGDRFMFLMIFMALWHLMSAWRRNPVLAISADNLMFLEEAVLMIITILLAVSALVKNGKKRGWSIFQGNSSLFWGIAFGYAYAGSISSLTILSAKFTESSLLQTTALGHLLTSLVILMIIPYTIRKMGVMEEE